MSNLNPIQYISRDFQSILNDINNDPTLVDKPDWWKRIWAGVGDVISIWNNAQANNAYLSTAFTRKAVQALCQLIDYDMAQQTTSSGVCLFDVDTSLGTAIFPFTVSALNLSAKSQGSSSVSSKRFEARSSATFTSITSTFTTNYAVNNNLTVSVDFVYTGMKVRLVTTGALPTGLQTGKDYYIIYVNATTIKLANSRAEAFAGVNVVITSNGSGTNTVQLYSKAVTMYQQETISQAVSVGKSDGLSSFQEFQLPNALILSGTLLITINSISWSAVTTFVNSISTDLVFKFIQLQNQMYAIRFGDGTYGEIPGIFDIMAMYAFGGGADSNISVLNTITSYAGSETKIKGVTNATVFTGGADQESIVTAKNLAPILLKARDRAVTQGDFEALVLAYGGVANVKVNKNIYGINSCQVVGIANGGGNPSGALRTAIQSYLIDRTILESIDVRFDAATITSIAVTSAAHILSSYLWANVLPYFTLAYKLFLSEAGREIYTLYQANGISDAVTLINTVFSTTFASADYAQIQKLLDNLTYRNFGDVIYQSDVDAYIQGNVNGIDYMTIASFGTGFPLTLASNEITTPGVLTLTQI